MSNDLNMDPNKKLIYVKNNFKPEKIKQKNILDFLVHSENSLQKMLDQSNGDVMIALQNLRIAALIDDKIPKINEKLYAELLDTITLDKKRPLNLIYNERLKRLTYTQEKIYKVLAKMEEELIDEQDTSIKNNDRNTTSKNFLPNGLTLEEYIKKILNKEIGNINTQSASILDSIISAGTGIVGAVGTYAGLKKLTSKNKPIEGKKIKENKTKKENKIKKNDKLKTPEKPKNLPKEKPSKHSKLLKKFESSKNGKKIIGKIGKKALALGLNPIIYILYELCSVFYKIGYYYNKSSELFEPRVHEKTERIIFALCAGTSEWIKEQAELIEFLGDLIVFVCTNLNDFLTFISDEFIDPTVKTIIFPFLKMTSGILEIVSDLLNEVIMPCIKAFLKYGSFGTDAGYYGLEFFWNITDKLPDKIKNYCGLNETLNRASKHGYLIGGIFSNSRIAGNVTDIAQTYTYNELEEIRKHDDLSKENLFKIEAAQKAKKMGAFSDEEILLNRKRDQGLQKIINSLDNNDTEFGVAWHDFAYLAMGQIHLHPGNCILEGHYLKDKFLTVLAPNILAYNDKQQSIKESEKFFNALKTAIYKSGINTIDIKKWDNKDSIANYWLYFTVYGTIVLSYKIKGTIQFEQLKKDYEVLFPKLNSDGSAIINKVIGYFDPGTMKIIPMKVEQSDKVFKEVFKENIIIKNQNYHTIALTTTHYSSSEDFKNPLAKNNVIMPKPINMTPNIEKYSKPNVKVSKNEVTKQVWDYLINEMGFTKEQAAGIMGNMMQESSMNPKAKNSIGAYGLCQWLRSRYDGLVAFANKNGTDISDVRTQLEYLKWELENTHKGAYKAIRNAKTVEEATIAWVDKFERPGKSERLVEKRTAYAYSYLDIKPVTEKMQKIEETPQITNGSVTMATKASEYARSHAHSKSQGYCAKYVANALQANGFKFQRQPSAYMYHTNGVLSKMGFNVVHEGLNGFKAQKGDICVINKFGSHKHGHICIYDGNNWVSDFVQKNASPYSAGAPNGAWFYRYGNSPITANTQNIPNMSNDIEAFSNTKQPLEPYAPINNNNSDKKENSYSNFIVQNSDIKHEPHFGDAENLFDFSYNEC